MSNSSLSVSLTEEIFHKLAAANQAYQRQYPGVPPARQPIHTVYGGAHLFKAESCKKLGTLALASLAEYAPDAASFSRALGLPQATHDRLGEVVYKKVVEKLQREAVEDFRIDFEDGYGYRSDAEEDGHAESAALELARGMKENILPPFVGFRVKALNEESQRRSARTLDIFITTLLSATGGVLSENFVVTLPKPVIPEQVTCLVGLLRLLEHKHNLKGGAIKIELMVEQAHSLLNGSGQCNLPLLIEAAEKRCIGAHFGTYDYTASCDITADQQHMMHSACDFAREMMKVSLAGTAVRLSDGATNRLPIGPHRAAAGGVLTPEQKAENQDVVHRAWQLSYQHIRHSLASGFYQGWDLHPNQLPVRYAASYLFFLEGLAAASARLTAFIEKAARANLVCDVFDDAASGQGLLNYFLRAFNCGAIDENDIVSTGLSVEMIRTRSFLQILNSLK